MRSSYCGVGEGRGSQNKYGCEVVKCGEALNARLAQKSAKPRAVHFFRSVCAPASEMIRCPIVGRA